MAILTEADARGRISDDMADNLERVDLCRQFAAETGCYDSAYPYLNSNGAKVRIVYVETAYQELLLRNQRRGESVPVDVLHRLIRKLDVPSVVEAEVVNVRVD